MPLYVRESFALLAAWSRHHAVTCFFVKPPDLAPAKLRRLSLYLTQEQDAPIMPPKERMDALYQAA